MPEFIIRSTYRSGLTEHRCADDARHARRILAGLRGRYLGARFEVFRLSLGADVTAEFPPGRPTRQS